MTVSPSPASSDCPLGADSLAPSFDTAAAASGAAPPSWWQDVLLLWFMAGCFCLVAGYRGLWDADEARYAEIPREMLVTKHWFVPTLNGFTYLEKPQLTYWPTLLLYKLFGVHAAVARIPPSLFFLGTLTLVYDFARRFINREVAYAAAGMLLFQPLFSFLGVHVLTDGPLTFWLTLAMVSAGRLRLSDQPSRIWTALFWLGCLGAFFTKGLIGWLFPVCILALDLLIRGNPRQLTRMAVSLALGGLISLVIIAEWLYEMCAVVPGFLHYFFVTQHLDRFTGSQHGGNWYLFAIAIFAFSWPWWPLLKPAAQAAWRSLRAARGRVPPVPNAVATPGGKAEASATPVPAYAPLRGFLALWFAAIFVFFSLSRGQLITYFLPAIPALVLLLALEFHLAPPPKRHACLMLAWLSGWLAVAAVGVLLFSLAGADRMTVELTAGPVSRVVAGVLLMGVNVLFYLLFGHRFLPRKPGRDPLMGYMLLLLACTFGLGHLSGYVGSAAVAESALVADVAQADPNYIAVHWSKAVTETDRAVGLNWALQREIVHVGEAWHEEGDARRAELGYCIEQTSPEISRRLLFSTWPEFVASVAAREGTSAPLAPARHVLLFVPRNREAELPENLPQTGPAQIVGRYLVYHLVLGTHNAQSNAQVQSKNQ